MGVVRIASGLSLPSDSALEILLLQWHSAVPVDVAALTSVSATEMEEKRLILERFIEAMSSRPVRPTLVLAPELSMPRALLPLVDELCVRATRPFVFAFGLEFLTPKTYFELGKSADRVAALRVERSLVNAAGIWLSDGKGNTTRYLQSKRHVSKYEQKLSEGDETFVFGSPTEIPGERLNFLVAICSDFTNPEHVKELRHDVLEADVKALDFTFVLQMNEIQASPEFSEGARAYFAPPLKLTETTGGTLVFVNNAALATGTFGECKFHFPYHRVHFPDKAPPTFWIQNAHSYNFEAAVFRDNAPSLYAVTYRPHYLVDQTAGSNERTPFELALHASLAADLSQPLVFTELPAVLFWMSVETAKQASVRPERAAREFHADPSGESCTQWLNASAGSINWWLALPAGNDEVARVAMQTLFRWNPKSPLMDAKTPEPTLWAVEESLYRTIDAVTILRLAVGSGLNPQVTNWSHATLLGRPLVILVGGANCTAAKIIEDFRTQIGIHAAVDDDLVIVLGEHRGKLPRNEKPTKSHPPPDDITAGYAAGMEADESNITRTGIRPAVVISADDLYAEFCEASAFTKALVRLQTDVEETLR